MKKLCFLLAVTVLLGLTGCAGEPVTFEGRNWQVNVVQTVDRTAVIACSAAYAEMMQEHMDMSGVDIVDVVCQMEGGVATFTDKTNNKTYVVGYSTGEKEKVAAYGDVSRIPDTAKPFEVERRYAFDSKRDPHGLYVIAGDYEIFFQEVGFLESNLPA